MRAYLPALLGYRYLQTVSAGKEGQTKEDVTNLSLHIGLLVSRARRLPGFFGLARRQESQLWHQL